MILIMGLPGAGKSVQSQLIQDRLGFHWLSTGQLFRETNDPEIKAIMASGALVGDQHVCRMVGDKLASLGYDSTVLLDGFPRTTAQAEWLLSHAEDIDKHVKLILFLEVDDKVAAERLGSRGRLDDSDEAVTKRRAEALKIAPTIEALTAAGVPLETIDANGEVEAIFSTIKARIAQYV